MVNCMYLMEKEFGLWLQEELIKRGMSQMQLSIKSGVTPAQISRIISGSRGAGEKTLSSIAQGLNIAPETVFRVAGFLPPKKKMSLDVEGIVFLLEQLPVTERQEIEELIRFKVERKRAVIKKRPALSVLKDNIEQ
jgi:transcriptional regulator with XRE-family HTH domain